MSKQKITLTTISNQIQSISVRLVSVEGRLISVETRLIAGEGRLITIEGRLDEHGAILASIRNRLDALHGLVEKLAAAGVKQDFAFIEKQRGMFSYSGLTAEQVERLQKEDGIYALSTGRICVAALNTKNIDKVAKAIARVLA